MMQAVKRQQTRRRRWWLIGIIAAALLIWLGFIAYRVFLGKASNELAAQGAAELATTETPEIAVLAVTAEGEVVPLRTVDLSFTANGIVGDILAQEGEVVASGQALVSLAAEDLSSSAAQAEAGIRRAAASLRAAELQRTMMQARAAVSAAQVKAAQAGISVAEAQVNSAEAQTRAVATEAPVVISQAQAALAEAQARQLQAQAALEQAEATERETQAAILQAEAAITEAQAAVAQAEAVYETAKTLLDKTILRAPFAGKLASLELELGEAVNPGQPVLRLVNDESWLVKTTDLTELDVVNLEPAQQVSVMLDAIPDHAFSGTISKIAIASELKRGDVTYEVTIALDDTAGLPLRWGMTAFVTFQK